MITNKIIMLLLMITNMNGRFFFSMCGWIFLQPNENNRGPAFISRKGQRQTRR